MCMSTYSKRGRIIHVQEHSAGSALGIGYAAPIRLERAMREPVDAG